MIAYDSESLHKLDIFFFIGDVFAWPSDGYYTNYMLLRTGKPEDKFKPIGPTLLVKWS